MGFPMCLNLRKSLDKDQELVICDTNHEALERFQQQTRDEGPVRVVENGRQAVQAAVSHLNLDLENENINKLFNQ